MRRADSQGKTLGFLLLVLVGAIGTLLWFASSPEPKDRIAPAPSPSVKVPDPDPAPPPEKHSWSGVRVTLLQEGTNRPLDNAKLTMLRQAPPGATIERQGRAFPIKGFPHAEGRSNLVGQCTLSHPAEGSYYWKAEKEGWASAESEIFTVPPDAEGMRIESTFVLEREASLQLHLTAQGQPLKGARAVLLRPGFDPVFAETDPSGTARWRGLRSGPYWLAVASSEAEDSRYFSWPQPSPSPPSDPDFVLAAGEARTESMAYEGAKPASLLGAVKVNGLAPKETLEIVLRLLDRPRQFEFVALPPRSARIDANGFFAIRDLCPGRYHVGLGTNALQPTLGGKEILLAPGSTGSVDFSVQMGFLRGQIVDDRGASIPQSRVVLRATEEGKQTHFSLWTDGAGRFRTSSMLTGSYEMTVYPADKPAWHRQIEIGPEENDLGALAVVSPSEDR